MQGAAKGAIHGQGFRGRFSILAIGEDRKNYCLATRRFRGGIA